MKDPESLTKSYRSVRIASWGCTHILSKREEQAEKEVIGWKIYIEGRHFSKHIRGQRWEHKPLSLCV